MTHKCDVFALENRLGTMV